MKLYLIRVGNKRYYKYGSCFVDVDRFNDVLLNWSFMGYTIKNYSMKKGNRTINVWYV